MTFAHSPHAFGQSCGPTPHSLPRVGGLVLAAGSSSRMGRPKLLLPLGGEPLIAHVLRAALTCASSGVPLLEPLAAVVSPAAPAALLEELRARPRVRVVTAADAAQGQAHSLRTGLAHLLAASCNIPPSGACGPGAAQVLSPCSTLDGVCVLLGDQPLVNGALLHALLHAFAAQPDAFIVPTCHGQRGNPVIIPRAFFPQVLELRGDTGARPLLGHAQATVRTVEVGNPAVLLDADTPAAYAALCALVEASAEPVAQTACQGSSAGIISQDV